MTTPEIDTSNQGDPNKLIWEGEPLSVEFLDVDIDPHRDTLSPIASTIRDASGVYMDCYFNDDSASFSSTGQVGINPECSNLTPAKIKRLTRNTFNNLDFTLDDKMTGLTVTRRPEIYNLTVTDEDGANPHFFSVQYHAHDQAPSIFINSGHLSKEGKTINGYNDYQYTDAREHAKRHAEICAIITNSFLAKVGDSEQVKVLAKFPLGQVPSKELVVVPQPEYLQALENFPNYNDLVGLGPQIEELRDVASLFFTPKEMLEKYQQVPGAVLIHGPGGVGKTALAKATAKEHGFEFREFTFTDISARMVGDPQKKLQNIYDEARDLGHPVLVFFDECDGLFRNDAGGNEGVTLSLVTTLKRILGNPADYPNVLSIFATNSIKGFDEALLRAGRFNTMLAIDKPTDSVRVNVFIDKLARDGHHFVAELFFPLTADTYEDGAEFSGRAKAFESAIAESEGFTAADYEAVLAKLRATRMKHEIQTGEEAPLLSAQQLVAAILAHRKSRPN